MRVSRVIVSFCVNKYSNVSPIHAANFLSLRFQNIGKIKMSTLAAKKLKKNSQIGTHSDVFHCDEALACYMLKCLPKYRDAEIVRTRDVNVLKECDIVIDVGAVYDPSIHRYDHHQRSFGETLSTLRPDFGNIWNIKLSSAGLIYVHFGDDIIREILKVNKLSPLAEMEQKLIFEKVYENFIQEIDGIDNGIQMFDGEPKYRITSDISSRVGRLNPEWNSTTLTNMDIDKLFTKAMALVGEEFVDKLLYYIKIWLPLRTLVREAIDNRLSVHPSGEIVELKQGFPWIDHLFRLEKELGIENVIKFVIFPDLSGDWRARSVPVEPKSFVCRKFLKEEWRGLRGDQLSDKSGVPDSVFCHATGFIGGNKTREGILAMAVKSLEN